MKNLKLGLIIAAGVIAVILLCVFGVQSSQNKAFPTRIFLNMLGYEKQNYTYLDYEAPIDAPQNLFGE